MHKYNAHVVNLSTALKTCSN